MSDPPPSRVVLRRMKDPIHDLIEISDRLTVFIDTRQFQRLRHVKQMGTSYLVWPGASHNRFEHCLGVAHLARALTSHLQREQPELNITDRDVECVELAGLCHDLGHGPWSHVWDNMFMPKAMPNRPWQHEEGSETMLEHLISTNHIAISDADKNFIKDLIAGERRSCDPSEKQFLFDIVANKRNGLDVDRFDYFVRDSHMIGEPIKINLHRLLNSARVINAEICYDIKDVNNIYELYGTRFRLFKQIYHHKTAKAIEYMIVDALLAAEPYLHISSLVFDPKQFSFLSDEIMSRIEWESETNENLAPARAIFDRIKNRDLYKCVDYKLVKWDDKRLFEERVTSAEIVTMAREDFRIRSEPGDDVKMEAAASTEDENEHITRESHPPLDPSTLTEDDVLVSLAPMHYGMGNDNPLAKVKFYSKAKPDVARNAKPGDYSGLMPNEFGEYMLRVYTKQSKYYYNVQAGYRAILKKIEEEVMPEHNVPTPPATEPPSTPRLGPSRTTSLGSVGSTSSPASSFGVNDFTTVDVGFVPESPTKKHKWRPRGSSDVGSPGKKRRL
ncbi:HD-domain/PDEase-like protein [Hymenopellis radicata]|nr:HD-domain/PDEase-like protein [Hymenopellis radicata]